jgi:predicted transcriptional regulator
MSIKIANTQNILESGESSKLKLIKIIDSFPGIRYSDIIRFTGFNNGTLSYHLAMLEKYSVIRKLRLDSSTITRYFSISISSEESIIVGYLKIKSTSQIIKLLLQDRKQSIFTELVRHINKSLPLNCFLEYQATYQRKNIDQN